MDERRCWPSSSRSTATHLRAVAYRMLGSLSEADDAVQEAWLRLSRADTDAHREPRRLADDGRRRGSASTCCAPAGTRREEPLDAARARPDRARVEDERDPEHEALLADSVGLALLVVLETLAPAERLAFVLHDMFAVPFDEIAPIVDRSPERDAPARQPRPPPGAGRRPSPTPTWPASGRSSTPSSPPPAAATSTRWSRCSTPTSCCAPTAAPPTRAVTCVRGAEDGGAVGRSRSRWPRAVLRGRCWSTARPAWSSPLGRAPVLGHGLHRRRRQDRRHRRARRPRAPRAPGPVRPRRVGRARIAVGEVRMFRAEDEALAASSLGQAAGVVHPSPPLSADGRPARSVAAEARRLGRHAAHHRPGGGRASSAASSSATSRTGRTSSPWR